MKSVYNFFDPLFIGFSRKIALPFARFSLFIVFFWFGALKLFDKSPANPLVSDLLGKTMPFMGFTEFIFCLGIFEMIIGISFLFPKLVRVSIFLLAIHMVTTFMPLLLLPSVTWNGFMIPTLEGQYIIKNLLIIAVAIGLVSRMELDSRQNEIYKS